MGLERRAVELRAQDIAERISLERAADYAAIPVDILQDAVAVIWRDNSKVCFEAFVPGFGQVADRQGAFEQLQFKIEAQHDMQVVGHLVCVGADERAFNLVDGAIELIERDALKLFGELQPAVWG